jgi:hypothetical protein
MKKWGQASDRFIHEFAGDAGAGNAVALFYRRYRAISL